MKKYPYTESTDLIIYDQKPKKEKKQKVWLTAVCSALAASIFTAGVFGTGMYFMQKNMNNNTQSAAVASATTQSDDSSSSDSAQLALYLTEAQTVKPLNKAAVQELFSKTMVTL